MILELKEIILLWPNDEYATRQIQLPFIFYGSYILIRVTCFDAFNTVGPSSFFLNKISPFLKINKPSLITLENVTEKLKSDTDP